MIRPFGINEAWFIFTAIEWTLALSAVAFAGGAVGGLLVALARVSKSRLLNVPALAFIRLFQGTPLLMQLFLAYFGIALFGIKTSPWTAAAVALTLYTSAYLTEIWRGCVASIPKGQWEAAQSLALNFGEQLRHVVLPQALRIAVPPTVGFLVQVIKGTALASVIGFVELTKAGSMISNATYKPFLVYACVALLYFVLCFPVSLVAQSLERKLHGHRR